MKRYIDPGVARAREQEARDAFRVLSQRIAVFGPLPKTKSEYGYGDYYEARLPETENTESVYLTHVCVPRHTSLSDRARKLLIARAHRALNAMLRDYRRNDRVQALVLAAAE